MKLDVTFRLNFDVAVAPRTGAWIETVITGLSMPWTWRSPPARGRGLKPLVLSNPLPAVVVAPRTGAWIETCYGYWLVRWKPCRPPHGGVD